MTDLRDPSEALPVAIRANELSGGDRPNILDTLALAYFRNGDPDRALKTQRTALALLADSAPDRSVYEERIAEYEATVQRPLATDAPSGK